MGVSKNSGTPKSSILIGFHYKPSILGYPYFWKHPNGTSCCFKSFLWGWTSESSGLRLWGISWFLKPEKDDAWLGAKIAWKSDILGEGISFPGFSILRDVDQVYEIWSHLLHLRDDWIFQWLPGHWGPQVKFLPSNFQPLQFEHRISKQDENSIHRFLNDLVP